MTEEDSNAAAWKPKISRDKGPVYMAIVDALAADIAAGVLAPGARLPAQRTLAEEIGVDFSTVSRSYAEARRRGLVDAFVGQGTFVRKKQHPAPSPVTSGLVDLSMNMPPRFEDADLEATVWEGFASIGPASGLELLLRYQEPGGCAADRAAGVRWLSDLVPTATPDRLLVFPGAQGALFCIVGLLAGAGGAICAEALTYPGLLSLAAHLRIPLIEVAMDQHGLIPEALDAVCRTHRPKALYCTPTLNNPTTATMPLARRREVIAICRQHGIPIIEDDAYGPLAPEERPLADLAPDIVFYVGGLSKYLSPALRIAYLVAPDQRSAQRLAGALRATAGMATPIGAALATRWIEDGTASRVCEAIAMEAEARRAIARQLLQKNDVRIPEKGFHVWLELPAQWMRGEFSARLRGAGISVVPSDAFALGSPPECVRLSLGGASTRASLAQGLESIADLLGQSPTISSIVV